MRIYSEQSVTNFEFWAGAKDTVKHLTKDELNTIEDILEEIYPDGMDETELNDLFWHERDLIAEWLGYDDFEALMFRDENEDEDDDDDDDE